MCNVYIITSVTYRKFKLECKDSWLIRKIELGDIEFRSITEWNLNKNPSKVDMSDKDHPKIKDKNLWDATKAYICKEDKIDILIDNEPNYVKWVKQISPNTIFLLHTDFKSNKLFGIKETKEDINKLKDVKTYSKKVFKK